MSKTRYASTDGRLPAEMHWYLPGWPRGQGSRKSVSCTMPGVDTNRGYAGQMDTAFSLRRGSGVLEQKRISSPSVLLSALCLEIRSCCLRQHNLPVWEIRALARVSATASRLKTQQSCSSVPGTCLNATSSMYLITLQSKSSCVVLPTLCWHLLLNRLTGKFVAPPDQANAQHTL